MGVLITTALLFWVYPSFWKPTYKEFEAASVYLSSKRFPTGFRLGDCILVLGFHWLPSTVI